MFERCRKAAVQRDEKNSSGFGHPWGFYALRDALRMQPRAELVIHLGDGEEDLLRVQAEFPAKYFLQVRGNNDWGSMLALTGESIVNSVKIFYTHGHVFNVKLGEERLIRAAKDKGAKLVLYGHTHTPEIRYEDGLYIFNPGALRGTSGTYGVIDIDESGGILPAILTRKEPVHP